MFNLEEKKCPYYDGEKCLMEGCTMFDEKLENCAFKLQYLNMYYLIQAIEKLTESADPRLGKSSPFMVPPHKKK